MRALIRKIAKNPFGCIFASLISLSFIAVALFGLIVLIAMITAPKRLQGKLNEETLFHFNSDKIFVNFFTGKFDAKNVTITNPHEYEESLFAEISSIEMNVDPLDLIKSKLEIKEADIKVKSLFCVKRSALAYNIAEFFSRLKTMVHFAEKKDFKGIKIKIYNAKFADISDKDAPFKRNCNSEIVILIEDISSREKILSDIEAQLEKFGAEFMVQGIGKDK